MLDYLKTCWKDTFSRYNIILGLVLLAQLILWRPAEPPYQKEVWRHVFNTNLKVEMLRDRNFCYAERISGTPECKLNEEVLRKEGYRLVSVKKLKRKEVRYD